MNLVHLSCLYACIIQSLCSASCSIYDIAKLLKTSANLNRLTFISIFHCDNHLFVFGQINASSKKCLVQCFLKCLRYSKTLSCRLHFGPKWDFCSSDFLKRENGHLDRHISCFFLQSRLISQFFDCPANNDLGSQINNWNASHFADIGNGPGRTGVNLYHINFFSNRNKLNID